MATTTKTRRLKAKPGATKATAFNPMLDEAIASAGLAQRKPTVGVLVIDLERETKAANKTLRESLGDMLGILTRVGGFMKPEDQALLRKARRAHAGGQ